MSDTLDDVPLHHPFVLGIIGDSGSGKSTVSRGVRELIGAGRVSTLELDDYHRYSRAERQELQLTALNPMVHNLSLMQEHLQLLRRGRPVRTRSYDHTDGTFGPLHTLEPEEVVIVRGLLGFPTEELRACYDLTVFLYPEPDLLFRWKLRRDTKSRGYSEADVLKSIARHLLDSKVYVLPQADRADLVVRYEVADYEAPDTEVQTSLILRRAAADAVRRDGIDARFGEHVRLEEPIGDEGGLVIRIDGTLPAELVDAWGAEIFPDTWDTARFGLYQDEEGGEGRLVPLAFTQVLIADLTQKLRRPTSPVAEAQNEPVRVD
jgi:phosphoribulokinase